MSVFLKYTLCTVDTSTLSYQLTDLNISSHAGRAHVTSIPSKEKT